VDFTLGSRRVQHYLTTLDDGRIVELDGKRFFRTGDLGRTDEDGYFFLVDRLKRMINVAGFKVWPAEVEAMLYAHPAIQEAVVISRRDPRRGETVKAVVVLHVTNPNPVVPATPCNIKGRVLAIHGAADPVTPKPMMDAFEEEMTEAKVDWQVMMFGGAVHSFCDPTVNAGPTRYDEKLCRKSYMLMRDFFAETL